jgi:hypothetical protein
MAQHKIRLPNICNPRPWHIKWWTRIEATGQLQMSEADLKELWAAVITAPPDNRDHILKLQPFLGIRTRGKKPQPHIRGLVVKTGKRAVLHEVKWMPRLKTGWARLTEDSLLIYYGYLTEGIHSDIQKNQHSQA